MWSTWRSAACAPRSTIPTPINWCRPCAAWAICWSCAHEVGAAPAVADLAGGAAAGGGGRGDLPGRRRLPVHDAGAAYGQPRQRGADRQGGADPPHHRRAAVTAGDCGGPAPADGNPVRPQRLHAARERAGWDGAAAIVAYLAAAAALRQRAGAARADAGRRPRL